VGRRQEAGDHPETVCISAFYTTNLLHLPDRSVTLDSMISSDRTAGTALALPGVAVAAILPVGQLPKLLPIIIIQVAVPGPA